MIKKHLRSLYTFYRTHFFVGLLTSLAAAWMYVALGNPALTILYWFKVITTTIFFFNVNYNRRKEFYYYQNIGISKVELWTFTLAADAILYLALMHIANPN